MMRSLFTGVSGLRNHQVRLDVIGNNIANVNTVGFKANRVTFEEAYTQIVQSGTRPAAGTGVGGTNPIQIGLGMSVGSVDLMFTQGNLESTGVATDLAIQGDAFFVLSDGAQRHYTRSGNFQVNASGRLVAANSGLIVQGRMATAGVLSDEITHITIPATQKAAARATTEVSLAGNLDANAATGATRETIITVFDSQGRESQLKLTFTKNAAANTWDYSATVDKYEGGTAPTATGQVTFDANGALVSPASADFSFTPPGFTTAQTVTLKFGTVGATDGLSLFGGSTTAVINSQDGYTAGDLERITIDATGTITGAFTNGTTLTLAQIALADFQNPSGLTRNGESTYSVSSNSGDAVLGFAGGGSPSSLTAGALEMSNVDLAQEFTSMITAQRGFQSNARVITAADEMLQELVNIGR